MKRILLSISALILINGCACASIDNDRLQYAKKYIETRDDLSEETRNAILKGTTIIGMYPDEAVAASGAFFYAIKPPQEGTRISCANIQFYFDYLEDSPDSIRMPPDILWRQRFHPDNSNIALGFQNRTQYDTKDLVSFVVYFNKGRVVGIGDGINPFVGTVKTKSEIIHEANKE